MAGEIDMNFSGKLYFSKTQWKLLRDEGRDRTYAMNAGQQVIEYTEMITFPDLQENPDIAPIFPDAEYRGEGFFHHRINDQGRWV